MEFIMKSNTLTIALFTAVIPLSALAVTEGQDGTVIHPVALTDKDDTVVIHDVEGTRCTATLIGGNKLITAAHCGEGKSLETAYNKAYEEWIAVTQTDIAPEYLEYETDWDSAPMLDVAIWTMKEAVKHTLFTPISNVTMEDNALLRIYGYGGTYPDLAYAEQRSLANWHYGGYFDTVSPTCVNIEGAISADGFCERIDPNMVSTYELLGEGHTTGGDSGSAYINEAGYATAIHHSRSVYHAYEAGFKYHEIETYDDIYEAIAPDANLEGSYSSFGNRLDYPATQQFLLDAVNAWHYASWLPSVNTGDAVTVKFQSLHADSVNLLNTFTTTGDVFVDASTITCFGPEQEIQTDTHHSADTVAPFEVCEMSVTSNGGDGEIQLDDGQIIYVNHWVTDSNDNTGNDDSGGAFGPLGLLSLLLLGGLRRRFPNLKERL